MTGIYALSIKDFEQERREGRLVKHETKTAIS